MNPETPRIYIRASNEFSTTSNHTTSFTTADNTLIATYVAYWNPHYWILPNSVKRVPRYTNEEVI